MGADATAADDDDKGVAQLGESFVGEEDAVASQLFQDQCFVVVTKTRTAGQGDASLVFFALRGLVQGCAAEVIDLRDDQLLIGSYYKCQCYLLDIVLGGQFRNGTLQIVHGIPSFRILQADDGTRS